MGMQTPALDRAKRDSLNSNLAKQARERRNQQADGGVHAVDRSTKPNRKTEAAENSTVVRPPVRRWKKASHLPQMPELPGYRQKYVRVDGKERGDHRGVFKHLQEQWEFVRKSDFPKHALPTIALGQHGEVVGNGELVLMKLHEELHAQRAAVYNAKRDRALASIEADLASQSDPRMPIKQKRKSQIEHRRMKDRPRASVADDDDI